MSKASASARIVEAVRKQFGPSMALRVGDDNSRSEVEEVIPTGISVFDHYILGCGGIPVGRIGELFSEEGAGKSAFTLHCLAAVQRAGGVAVLVETEHGFSEERAKTYGVNVDDVVLLEPDTLEEVMGVTEVALEAVPLSAGPILVAWDSLAATPTKKEIIEGLTGEARIGERARVLSGAMRVGSSLFRKRRASFMIVNQIRHKFGVMFGDNTTTPGGNAVKFHASWRLRLYSGKAAKDGKDHTGKAVTFQAIKNRFAPPYRKAHIHLDYVAGWDEQATLLEFAKDRKLIAPKERGEAAYAEGLRLCKERNWSFTGVQVESPDENDSDGGSPPVDDAGE